MIFVFQDKWYLIFALGLSIITRKQLIKIVIYLNSLYFICYKLLVNN